jgi:SpoU rRNA methylase family enzyme
MSRWLRMKIIPVIHNVSSVQRVVDMARLVYSLGLDELVVSKAYGAAAQHGIPEASRLALKLGKTLVVLPDLKDAIELLRPDEVLIISFEHAKERTLDFSDLKSNVLAVVFSGSEPDFSPEEIRLGKTIYIPGATGRLGPIAEAGIVLYALITGRGVEG